MPNYPQMFSSPVAANVTVTNAVETVVATLSGITTDGPGRRIALNGMIEHTTGTSTTAMVLRIRRGTDTTGTVVQTTTETIEGIVGSTDPYSIEAIDTPGDVNNQAYVLTVQQTGGAGAGTTVTAELTAGFLS